MVEAGEVAEEEEEAVATLRRTMLRKERFMNTKENIMEIKSTMKEVKVTSIKVVNIEVITASIMEMIKERHLNLVKQSLVSLSGVNTSFRTLLLKIIKTSRLKANRFLESTQVEVVVITVVITETSMKTLTL